MAAMLGTDDEMYADASSPDAQPLFHALISIAPVSDFRYYDTIWTERYMGTPQENDAVELAWEDDWRLCAVAFTYTYQGVFPIGVRLGGFGLGVG